MTELNEYEVREKYIKETRNDKLKRYLIKKERRVWRKKVAYTVRQKIANDKK